MLKYTFATLILTLCMSYSYEIKLAREFYETVSIQHLDDQKEVYWEIIDGALESDAIQSSAYKLLTYWSKPLINEETHVVKDTKAIPKPFQSQNQTCNDVGALVRKHTLLNKCIGKDCYSDQISCNGITYTKNNFTAYDGDISTCLVNQITCNNVSLDIEEPCMFHSFRRPDSVILEPAEVQGEQISLFQNQIQCNHSFYGFEVFDYECENQELICNNRKITNFTQGYPVQPGCQILKTPCKDVSNSSQYSKIDIVCQNDWLNNLCNQTVDWSSSCLDQHDPLLLKTMLCDGNIIPVDDNFKRPLFSCESVNQVSFRETIYNLPVSNDTVCIIADVYCYGVYIPFLFPSIPENCSVGHIMCYNPNQLDTGCTTYNIGCNNGGCVYKENLLNSHDNCNQYGYGQVCECPVDYKGADCEQTRSIQCAFDFSSPDIPLECDKVPNSPEFPVCARLKPTETFEIKGLLDCWFPDGTLDVLKNNTLTEFQYAVVGDKIALTNKEDWAIQLLVHDFITFSQSSPNPKLTLNELQMTGKETIDIDYSLEKFKHAQGQGGRVYTELKFELGKGPISMESEGLGSIMFHVSGLEVEYPSTNTKTGLIVGLSVGGVLLVIAVLTLIMLYRRKKK